MRAYHRLVALLDELATMMPDGYVLGYALADDEPGEDAALNAAAFDAADATFKTGLARSLTEGQSRHIQARARADAARGLSRTERAALDGRGSDLNAVPKPAADGAGHHVLIEIVHLPTGISVVRWLEYAPLRALAVEAGASRTKAVRRDEIRDEVGADVLAFVDECSARVSASGWKVGP